MFESRRDFDNNRNRKEKSTISVKKDTTNSADLLFMLYAVFQDFIIISFKVFFFAFKKDVVSKYMVVSTNN